MRSPAVDVEPKSVGEADKGPVLSNCEEPKTEVNYAGGFLDTHATGPRTTSSSPLGFELVLVRLEASC
jgi:hypothetical protein